MQFLKMAKDMTLSALSSIVGERNVDTVLNANSLERSVNIGSAFDKRNKQIISQFQNIGVDNQKKLSILNQFVGDSDIYEKAYLGPEDDWITLSQYNCFTDAIRIPEEVKLPPSEGLLGNSEPIPTNVYRACTESLKVPNTMHHSLTVVMVLLLEILLLMVLRLSGSNCLGERSVYILH